MTTSSNPTDLAEFGIGADEAAESGLSDLDLNDPEIADLIRSFAAPKLDPVARLAEIESGEDPAKDPLTPTTADEGAGEEELAVQVGELPPPAPDAQPAPIDPTLLYTVDTGNGQTATISQQQALEMLQLSAWAKGLNPDTARAMADVEEGRGYVIPRDEAEAYRAWKAAGSKAPVAGTAPVLDEYSTDTERALADKLAQLESTIASNHSAQVDEQRRQIELQQQQDALARAEIFGTTFTNVGAESGLTPEQVDAALQHAYSTGLIRDVNNSLTQLSPTGQVLRLPDAQTVARETLTRAINAVPELRDARIAAEVESRLSVERSAILATNNKKNLSASLATAPSAATPSGADVRAMTPQQREAAMANEIRQAMSAG